MKYLIVKCTPLSDPWECEVDREPILVCNKIPVKYKKFGYEHYEIQKDGSLELIKHWEE